MKGLDGTWSLLIHPHVGLVAAGIFVMLRWLSSTSLAQVALYKRFIVIAPELLGVLAMTVGAAPDPNAPIAVNVLLGLWSSYVAVKFRKIIGQSVLGDDTAIEVARAPALEAAIRRSGAPPPLPSLAPMAPPPAPPASVPAKGDGP